MKKIKLLMIDNYDSFTFNLFQYFGILGAEIKVYRNDEVNLKNIEKKYFNKIVISPGPKTPDHAGISLEVIDKFKDKFPILGVCLGHQTIGQYFGGKIIRAQRPMHGKTSQIYHDNDLLFKKIPSPFEATRYHSLVIEKKTLPQSLTITATSNDDNEIMAIRHKTLPIFGIQFHPESILTTYGMDILKNWLEIS